MRIPIHEGDNVSISSSSSSSSSFVPATLRVSRVPVASSSSASQLWVPSRMSVDNLSLPVPLPGDSLYARRLKHRNEHGRYPPGIIPLLACWLISANNESHEELSCTQSDFSLYQLHYRLSTDSHGLVALAKNFDALDVLVWGSDHSVHAKKLGITFLRSLIGALISLNVMGSGVGLASSNQSSIHMSSRPAVPDISPPDAPELICIPLCSHCIRGSCVGDIMRMESVS